MSKKLKEVFTVDLNTQDEDNQGRPVYVVSTRKEAERRVRILNEQEAWGVELTEDKLDISKCDENYRVIGCGHPHRFYNVGSFEVDGPFYEEGSE